MQIFLTTVMYYDYITVNDTSYLKTKRHITLSTNPVTVYIIRFIMWSNLRKIERIFCRSFKGYQIYNSQSVLACYYQKIFVIKYIQELIV